MTTYKPETLAHDYQTDTEGSGVSRLGRILLPAAFALSGCVSAGETPPPAPTPNAAVSGLPNPWPKPVKLGALACDQNGGEQNVHMIGDLVAAYVDGRCNGVPEDPIGLYHSPRQTPAGTAPYRADNGQTFVIRCVNLNGQQVNDDYGWGSTTWVRGVIANDSTGGVPVEAYGPIVNFGRLDAPVGQVPNC